VNLPWQRPKPKQTVERSKTEVGIGRETTRTERQWKRVLVPALETPYSMRSLQVAYRLAQGTGGSVKLAFILEVPRALPLDSALPDLESVALAALEDARVSALPYGIPIEPFVHRTRSAADGILKLIAQEGIDLLVLGGRPDGLRGLPSELNRELFRRAPCEVVLDYIADEK
jgi:nucleotide-binding universal stress UspA family protein